MERTETKYGCIAVELKDSTVRAGEALCGTVIINAREPIAEFSAVRVVIVGVAQTQICKGALRDRQKLDGSEQVCFGKIAMFPEVAGRTADGKWRTLAAGEHKMAFRITLPPNAPHSDELDGEVRDASAKVNYLCGARLIVPEGGVIDAIKKVFTVDTVKIPVTVLPCPQPQVEATMAEPIRFEESKSFLISRSKGELSAKIALEKQFFYAGDSVNFKVAVVNESNKTVKKISVALCTFGHVKASFEEIQYCSSLATSTIDEVIEKGERRTIEAVLEIPADYGKYSLKTTLFSRLFAVQCTLQTSGLTSGLEVKGPFALLVKPAASA